MAKNPTSKKEHEKKKPERDRQPEDVSTWCMMAKLPINSLIITDVVIQIINN